MKKQRPSDDLTQMPYVGNSIANDFKSIGITKVSDLKDKSTEALYSQICATKRQRIDRCLLYICRSSVYFAENTNPDPEKLKWWNWKEKKV